MKFLGQYCDISLVGVCENIVFLIMGYNVKELNYVSYILATLVTIDNVIADSVSNRHVGHLWFFQHVLARNNVDT